MLVCPLHWYYDRGRLEAIATRMEALGAPALRGFCDGRVVLLREGTHRIRAAMLLGLVPTIVPVPWWRSRQALVGAFIAAERRGLHFDRVHVMR